MRAEPLRSAAESLCGQVRRDRGDGLYIIRAQVDPHPFFTIEPRGGMSVLTPSAEGMRALSGRIGPPKTVGFGRFSAMPCSSADILLLCRGIKLLETDCPAHDAQLYERDIRRRAAELLRTRACEGGSLPVCMRIAELISKNPKGEDQK